MKKVYTEVLNAHLSIKAPDATYDIKFSYEKRVGAAWEFDPMSDSNQTRDMNTGNMLVEFVPFVGTMEFSEDKNRPMRYLLPIKEARDLYVYLKTKNNTPLWYSLDIASFYQRKAK